jgi:hypothetical protein
MIPPLISLINNYFLGGHSRALMKCNNNLHHCRHVEKIMRQFFTKNGFCHIPLLFEDFSVTVMSWIISIKLNIDEKVFLS